MLPAIRTTLQGRIVILRILTIVPITGLKRGSGLFRGSSLFLFFIYSGMREPSLPSILLGLYRSIPCSWIGDIFAAEWGDSVEERVYVFKASHIELLQLQIKRRCMAGSHTMSLKVSRFQGRADASGRAGASALPASFQHFIYPKTCRRSETTRAGSGADPGSAMGR